MPSEKCDHRSTEEVQPHKWLLKLEREVWPLNARAQMKQDHSVTWEVRRAKVLRLQGDGGTVTVGLDTPKWQGKRLEANLPSQGGRDVRSCSGKLARAEFYSSRYHRRDTSNRGSSQVVDREELEKALREMGI